MPNATDAHSAIVGIGVTLLFLIALVLIAQTSDNAEKVILAFMVALLVLAGILHGKGFQQAIKSLTGDTSLSYTG